MGARGKHNEAFILGPCVIAGFVGWLTESLSIFIFVEVLLVSGALLSGSIRLQPRGR